MPVVHYMSGMDPSRLKELLERVRAGEVDVEGAAQELRTLPYVELGYARVDHHRALRQGVPEVILGEGKTAEQIIGISNELIRSGQNVLITRLDVDKAKLVVAEVRDLKYSETPRVATYEKEPIEVREGPPVAVITAGTSDIPVAEEACETLRMLGVGVARVFDVGVAGIHRVIGQLDVMSKAPAVIVAAGMEGALPSVIGGLIGSPVVAVPTSVGYGASLGGLTALFGILSGCAAGVTVVNIDNGFGAAMAVARMVQARERVGGAA